MSRRRAATPVTPPTVCGHPADHPRLVPCADGLIWVCPSCRSLFDQANPIPCIGCGGFDCRPGSSGEFNAPTGYYGGGFHLGDWFPWCPECLSPLPVTCSRCSPAPLPAWDGRHTCGRGLQLHPKAPENLWFRVLWGPLTYPSMGIELRHLLGARDWPGTGDPIRLPDPQSLWPSLQVAEDAIRPFLEQHQRRMELERQREEATPQQLNLL